MPRSLQKNRSLTVAARFEPDARCDPNGRSRRFTAIKARSATAVCHRRRGSVLVLVMTLLGILFVTGVAFLASMNFEAEIVSIERGRDQRDVGIEAVLDETVSSLRQGLVGKGGTPFGGSLDEPFASTKLGVAPAVMGELPGVTDLLSPIEPVQEPSRSGNFRFLSFTDLQTVMGPGDGSFSQTLARRKAIGNVDVASVSGVPIDYIDENGNPAVKYPVDSDGDGVTDTYEFLVSQLGFSKAQIAELSRTLNPTSNPDGDVFLGMRVIAHGGMVNLNESHPTLISNVLDLPPGYELTRGPVPGELPFFDHRPSTTGVKYAPQLEEPVLRRRVLLPPRIIAPSLLQGNALLDPTVAGMEFGSADMPTKLFPSDPRTGDPLESVFEGAHRYVPFDGLIDAYDPNTPLWLARMEPFASFSADNTGHAYDRRHLVTTVSHDDLLSRGGRVVSALDTTGVPIDDMDLREAMIDADRKACASSSGFPFEYADYPQDMEPGGCACLSDPNCKPNVRKGRLALSLAWLDDNFPCESLVLGSSDRAECTLRRSRMIQDAFMMLLRNAHGAYWDEIDCSTPATMAACLQIGERCDTGGTGQCYDPVTGLSHRETLISRTAASLTANLIDYMDAEDFDGDGLDDGLPTRVALRSFDFSNPDTVGRELGPGLDPNRPEQPQQFVFGLERQPYITEVTTAASRIDPATVRIDARAVELYNPYLDDLIYKPGVDEYILIEVTAGMPDKEIPLQRDIVGGPNGMFTVFRTDPAGNLTVPSALDRVRVYNAGVDMSFTNQSILYLVRRVRLPGESNRTDIVVDQFTLDGQFTGNSDVPDGVTTGTPEPFIFSLERHIPDQTVPDRESRWTATVPDAIELPLGVHTLGKWSVRSGAKPMPVEVNFANTGSFTRPDPADNPFDPVRGVAFPTTGSMLLLMRHANRPFSDRSIVTTLRGSGGIITSSTKDLSFTTRLDQITNVEVSPGFDVPVREREQIDNGRMPVFDPPVRECIVVGSPPSGLRCRSNTDCTGGTTCEQVAPGVHHADPSATAKNTPGALDTLPWGQLLWDYFTVLPLSSSGPYTPPPGVDRANFEAAKPDSIPRVDLDGLRVHGRININAAPWMVIGGLPLTPMRRIPAVFRLKIAGTLAKRRLLEGVPDINDRQAGQLGINLAMGVVAYRDAREISFPTPTGDVTTGDFGGDWRGWEGVSPVARRGTGFLSLGELANVRHTNASDILFRIDSGELDAPAPDYVKAVAVLASMGDWVTVRSHVFTMYGTLRGEGDTTITDELERARDVDKRAVRFQETVDRLPAFLGASKPSRIGQRYVGPYIDVRND